MENLPPNLELTLIDIDSIEQLNPLDDATQLIEERRKRNLQDGYLEVLRRSQFFSDEDVKFKKKPVFEEAGEKLPRKLNSKAITAFIVIIVITGISIWVIHRHKKYRKEDEELLEKNPDAPYSLMRDIRSTDMGRKSLIAAEIFFFLFLVLGLTHILNKITTETNKTFTPA